MRKKIGNILLLCGIAAGLAACGQEAASAKDLAQSISLDAGGVGNAESGGRAAGETETTDRGNTKEAEGRFAFVYEGVTFVPGELVDHDTLPAYSGVAEVPSCAFGGNDNVYDFGQFELTAYFDGEEERVYSIYFLDPNLPTTEGLCMGDTAEEMQALYGEDYETDGDSYTYTRGETSLIVIVQNKVVVSVEYRLGR